MSDRNTLIKILDLARWAPSGDNTQPCRFEIVSDHHIAIHGHDTREWCLYDFDGRASYMAHGALLETLRIAATAHRLRATWSQRTGTPDTAPIYDVYLECDSNLTPDPLIPFIKTRTVQRRRMQMTPLTSDQRGALCTAPGAGFNVEFFESFTDRRKIANLLWDNAYIRLTCPEAYQVHKKVIEWGARFSEDRIPEQAVGVDPLTARLMRWVMQSWERLDFFNRYLLGTIAPRVQLDYLPAIYCAGHLLIRGIKEPQTLMDFVAAGCAMQRVWLTCAAQGLFLQPEITPIIFNWYAATKKSVSHLEAVNQAVLKLATHFNLLFGSVQLGHPVFLCRIGISSEPFSRSTRLPLKSLMLTPDTHK
jgi:hypothetical protein